MARRWAVAPLMAIGLMAPSVAAAQTPALSCGDLVAGSIDTADESDFFTFSGQEGDQIFVTLAETGDFPGSQVAAQALVFSPTGQPVVFFNANMQQSITLPETGTYVVKVRANNLIATGTYNLSLECLLPLGPTDGNLLCGDLLMDSIDVVGDADFFTFDGQEGNQIFVTLAETGDFPGSQVAAQALVFSPTGQPVVFFNANMQQPITLPETGTYAIKVRSSDLIATGTYNLNHECLIPLGPVQNLSLGDLVHDSIDKQGEADFFAFNGQEADQIFVTLAETGGFPGVQVAAQALVFSPTGQQIVSFNANAQQPITLPASGTHAIKVRASNLIATGTYCLAFDLSPVPFSSCTSTTTTTTTSSTTTTTSSSTTTTTSSSTTTTTSSTTTTTSSSTTTTTSSTTTSSTTSTTSTTLPKERQTLCHVDGPEPVTITVALSAVPAHLRHGDTLGACP